MPKRVQIQSWRKPGGKKPDNVVIVARPSKWGNPFRIGDATIPNAAEAVHRFRRWIVDHMVVGPVPPTMEEIAELRGKDLGCYCKLTDPCHADVLLELANKDTPNAE